MEIDPRAKRFLDMLAIAGPPAGSRETIAERRDGYQALMRLSNMQVPPCGIEERVIPGPDGPVTVRIYTPAGTRRELLPGLVYFHGGGLVAGSLDDYQSLCAALANETGCRLVSVGYRLAPEHKFPAAVMDSYAAVQWIVERANTLKIDRNRIAVGGDSAGGTLAAVVCQMAKEAKGPSLALQLLLCPVLDSEPATASRRMLAEGHLLDRATMQRDLAHYASPGFDPTDARVSPLRAANLSGLPAAHIHTAEFDPLRDEGKAYAERLAQAGVAVNYTCHQGMIHHFYAMASIIPYARHALKLIGTDIRSALA